MSTDAVSTEELSKNARKRLLKAEKYASIKAERRARDKEKKRLRAEERKTDPSETREPDAKRRKVRGHRNVFKARIVIDLGFDDLMSEKEVVSLCSQLAYTYSSNRHSCNPFESILCTSLNGKTLSRLHALHDQHTRWSHVQFLEKGYETLWTTNDEDGQPITIPKDSIVYLTGDSDEELLELKEGETYIIGGICDHNRYKNLCLNKARDQSIRHARLPIGTYLQEFPTRKILTVNQVFDILLQWVEHRDWEKALYAVMPKRKFNQTSKKMGGTSQVEESSDPEKANEATVDDNSELNDLAAGRSTPDNTAVPTYPEPS